MTRKTVLSLLILLALGLCLSPAVHAQASRTWVSGVGDDANPCSRTAPCKTFAGAISKTAAGGEINAIDPAGYGAVTITKSITIDGGGTFASILSAGTNGIVINAAATDVITIRNLSINGFGTGLNGIRFLAGGALHVEGVEIFRFTQNGIDFQPTTNATLFVRDSQISDNNAAGTVGGILIKPGGAASVVASIADTMLDRNRFGLRVEDRSTVTVTNTTAMNSNANGFQSISAGGPVALNLDRCVAASGLQNGIQSNGPMSTVRMTNCLVTGNAQGLATPGGMLIAIGHNVVAGNTMDGSPTMTIP